MRLLLPMWMMTACAALGACANAPDGRRAPPQPTTVSRSAALLTIDGLTFRDLNHDGRLDPYEDWRLAPCARTRDLVGHMTLEEKAGVMIHGTVPLDAGGRALDLAAATALVATKHINTLLTRQSADARTLAATQNALQALAEGTRLGIPVTVSSDPRNHFQQTVGQGVAAGAFSTWPDPLGLAASGDAALTRRFADVVRQEYLAVGIRAALSPQADLATEPRWSRIYGTFGEDADTARAHVQGYVEGLQDGAGGIRESSVIAVVKHWAGYGAAKDGWDSHNPYGKFMSFPSANFAYHLKPFDGAFAAHAGAVMPTYSMPDGDITVEGVTLERVGGAFNKPLLTDLLRGRRGFDGVVVSDWAVTKDCAQDCASGIPKGANPFAFFEQWGTPWGVEEMSPRARMTRAVHAGVDQFGGTDTPELLVEAVRNGELDEASLDRSVTRILLQKFQQGLFDNPFVDEAQAPSRVNTATFHQEALDAQRRSLVLLRNQDGLLPIAPGKKVLLHGFDAEAARRHGLAVVDDPAQADVALMRMAAPFQLVHPDYIFGVLGHEGSLAFHDDHPDYAALKRISARVPTVVTIYLDRPAVLANVVDKAAAVVANFGAGDDAVLDVLMGRAAPQGRLPVELPSSDAAVERQRFDLPHDSVAPLFPFGFGLSYDSEQRH